MTQTTDLNHADPLFKAVAKVRSKVGEPHVIFDDADYLSDLEDTGGNVLRAAATRLIAIANSEAHIQKVQKTLELETDGSKLSASYLASAKMFIAMADAGGTVTTPTEPETPVPMGKTYHPRRVDGYTPRYYVD